MTPQQAAEATVGGMVFTTDNYIEELQQAYTPATVAWLTSEHRAQLRAELVKAKAAIDTAITELGKGAAHNAADPIIPIPGMQPHC